MLNSWKTIFSYFFISFNKIVAQRTYQRALGQMSKNVQVYFIHINFFEKPNKKIYSRAKELSCDVTIFLFWFFIVYLLKKNGNWKMAQSCWLFPTWIILDKD